MSTMRLPTLSTMPLALLFVLLPSALGMTALARGDTVTVFGASGNVGKLVALRLADEGFAVRGVVRDRARARAFLGDRVDLFEADLNDLPKARAERLAPALDSANALVICTGTTAFPTKAWSPDGQADVTPLVLQALLGAKLSVPDALAALDAQGLNTPRNVDQEATTAILEAWAQAAGEQRKRLVLMSSIGVQRREQMPFPVLNACGVLDAKAAAEAAIKADAAASGYSYTVVRPGQLFGGPYDNNYYLGTLFQLDKDAETRGISVGRGDTLIGDTLRSSLAETIAQLMAEGSCLDVDFSVVNEAGDAPSVERLRAQLAGL